MKSKSKEHFQQVELVLPSVLGVCRGNKAWILLCLTNTSCLPPTSETYSEFSCAQSLSRVLLFAIPWTIAHQAPMAMGFPRQEYWSWLPFPSPGAFPTQGSNPHFFHPRHWQACSLPPHPLENTFKWGLVIIEENNFVWRKAKSLLAYKKHAFWWIVLSINSSALFPDSSTRHLWP